MNKTQEAINFLNNVSNDLHSPNFNQDLINIIKQNISNAANVIDTVIPSNNSQIIMLDSIVNECISSLHNILKEKSIDQQTEDLYANLSANIYCIREQVERIKNS